MCGGERCGDFRCSKVQTITSPNTICNNKRKYYVDKLWKRGIKPTIQFIFFHLALFNKSTSSSATPTGQQQEMPGRLDTNVLTIVVQYCGG